MRTAAAVALLALGCHPAAPPPPADAAPLPRCASRPLARGLVPLLQEITTVAAQRAGPGSRALVVPAPAESARFADAVLAALGGGDLDCDLPPSYRVVRIDDDRAGPVLVAAELDEQGTAAPQLFWGTYAALAAPDRELVVEAPHPLFDYNTWREAADLFREGRAAWLLVSGAHRCADPRPSGCDGSTKVCGAMGPFPISDAAHSTALAFHAVHTALANRFPALAFLQLHGEATAGCPAALISVGAPPFPAAGEAAALATTLERGGLLVGRCHDATGGLPSAACPLCGETNVQARFAAGSLDACTRAGGAQTRVVLVEQASALAQTPAPARPGYQVVIDAALAAYPARAMSTERAPVLAGTDHSAPQRR